MQLFANETHLLLVVLVEKVNFDLIVVFCFFFFSWWNDADWIPTESLLKSVEWDFFFFYVYGCLLSQHVSSLFVHVVRGLSTSSCV